MTRQVPTESLRPSSASTGLMPNTMSACKPLAPQKREFSVLEHQPEAIDAWVSTLRTRFKGQPIAVCLELNKGPIVSALRKYDFLVLFPVNPLTLARYREAFTPSHAKDDPTDAELQRRAPAQASRQAHTPQPPKPRHARPGATRRTSPPPGRRQSPSHQSPHQCPEKLLPACPPMVSTTKTPRIFCDFLSRWPTLKAAQLARRSTLRALLPRPSCALRPTSSTSASRPSRAPRP